MKRTALCHCGQLRMVCDGDPTQVLMCHCEFCQRRTGTSYNLGAWFPSARTAAQGREKTYVRTGDQGSEVTFHFCPDCGTNIYWEAPGFFPDMFGVAVGCFVDPNFPAPTLSFYGKRRHAWLTVPPGTPSLDGGAESAPG